MRTRRAWTAAVAGSATVLALGLTPLTMATAAPGTAARTTSSTAGSDMRELDPGARAKEYPIRDQASRQALRQAQSDPGQPPVKGDTRTWAGYDEYNGSLYLKRYVL